jgi:hypothetical protein
VNFIETNVKKKFVADVDFHYQSLYLNPTHFNKNLKCVVSHVSLDQGSI